MHIKQPLNKTKLALIGCTSYNARPCLVLSNAPCICDYAMLMALSLFSPTLAKVRLRALANHYAITDNETLRMT